MYQKLPTHFLHNEAILWFFNINSNFWHRTFHLLFLCCHRLVYSPKSTKSQNHYTISVSWYFEKVYHKMKYPLREAETKSQIHWLIQKARKVVCPLVSKKKVFIRTIGFIAQSITKGSLRIEKTVRSENANEKYSTECLWRRYRQQRRNCWVFPFHFLKYWWFW